MPLHGCSLIFHIQQKEILFYRLRLCLRQKAIIKGARAAEPQKGKDGFEDGAEVGWTGGGVCFGSGVAIAVTRRFMFSPASP